MSKVTIIGAGNVSFTEQFLMDMFSTPCMNGSTYVLMGPHIQKLERLKQEADRMIGRYGIRAEIQCTTKRREALADADFVFLVLGIGGIKAYTNDIQIPARHNVVQCVGDTMGPGGLFALLRSVPVLTEIVREMECLCSHAVVFNYVNPMGAVCTVLRRLTSMNIIGICNGVQSTVELISKCVGIPSDELRYTHAGINHMDWFLKLEHNGKDIYPEFKTKMEMPQSYKQDKVRVELMRQCGYFMTETSGHLSEYLPWFRKNKKALDTYCDLPLFGGETGAVLKYKRQMQERYNECENQTLQTFQPDKRSREYSSHIIEAMLTDKPYTFSGNIENNGYITNLPDGATVEIPVCADSNGFHGTYMGILPKPCAAMNLSNIVVQDMAVDAAINGDTELAFWAAAMDPLTGAVLTLQEIRNMVSELFQANKSWLPQFDRDEINKMGGMNV